jgi:hypothetical protein
MIENLICEEYSSDKQYRYLICKKENYFEVWLQKRITDEYMGPDWYDYTYIRDYKHVTDTLERAIEIGREGLKNLSGQEEQ